MVNVKPVQLGKNTRMSFSHINEVLDMPNLIEIQKNSYYWFLKEGLKEVFDDVSGITDFNGNLVLDFVNYKLDEKPNYTVTECKERDATYAAALRVTARLLNKETGEREEISKIVPQLKPGATVSLQRNDAMYIVTEYGAVNLMRLSVSDRAKKLISIAHPKFREGLTLQAKALGLIKE